MKSNSSMCGLYWPAGFIFLPCLGPVRVRFSWSPVSLVFNKVVVLRLNSGVVLELTFYCSNWTTLTYFLHLKLRKGLSVCYKEEVRWYCYGHAVFTLCKDQGKKPGTIWYVWLSWYDKSYLTFQSQESKLRFRVWLMGRRSVGFTWPGHKGFLVMGFNGLYLSSTSVMQGYGIQTNQHCGDSKSLRSIELYMMQVVVWYNQQVGLVTFKHYFYGFSALRFWFRKSRSLMGLQFVISLEGWFKVSILMSLHWCGIANIMKSELFVHGFILPITLGWFVRVIIRVGQIINNFIFR